MITFLAWVAIGSLLALATLFTLKDFGPVEAYFALMFCIIAVLATFVAFQLRYIETIRIYQVVEHMEWIIEDGKPVMESYPTQYFRELRSGEVVEITYGEYMTLTKEETK